MPQPLSQITGALDNDLGRFCEKAGPILSMS